MQRIIILIAAIAAAGFGAFAFQAQQANTTTSQAIYATDLNGQTVHVSQSSGKPKLVNFWASWCKPCVVELPLLEQYAAEHADEIEVLALAIDNLANVKTFLENHPLELPVAVGTAHASELMVEWGNDKSALPFSVLLGADGTLQKKHLGPFDADSLQAFARQP